MSPDGTEYDLTVCTVPSGEAISRSMAALTSANCFALPEAITRLFAGSDENSISGHSFCKTGNRYAEETRLVSNERICFSELADDGRSI